ncbi:hypothetical protein BCL90_1966 [Pedobacter alluvionis]|uniref:Uncharacterized protein n=1 Tax=Pedobacter alluvionis TaxID=475253 RepID=A0A497Y334_9SPHI|nr:hypothetical protein BCL90_1966 [Pedobacter alluvionis]
MTYCENDDTFIKQKTRITKRNPGFYISSLGKRKENPPPYYLPPSTSLNNYINNLPFNENDLFSWFSI